MGDGREREKRGRVAEEDGGAGVEDEMRKNLMDGCWSKYKKEALTRTDCSCPVHSRRSALAVHSVLSSAGVVFVDANGKEKGVGLEITTASLKIKYK